MTKHQLSAIKEIAGQLAWDNVWRYQDQTNRTIVFVIEVVRGRTVSRWHLSKLIEGIEEVLGPGQAFVLEGLEDTSPDTWLAMQPL
ncbi:MULTISPECIES: hypothetical protein [unclassified Arthrobacter]|uniref:hypothetical protein n=1 Tax=unclassified Arthrobacter TaxID=235627 RepID=UPI002E0771BE|nr:MULTISPECIES: hypothetical protein [unclassified Arthrobacter]MEC5193537.1 hypothetical protein [Arthrobacter sp. MP_M4]MEC5205014.1 hypothetical protein [Arthrobacter sp. MP_M7]